MQQRKDRLFAADECRWIEIQIEPPRRREKRSIIEPPRRQGRQDIYINI
jgi:hypothetical protein